MRPGLSQNAYRYTASESIRTSGDVSYTTNVIEEHADYANIRGKHAVNCIVVAGPHAV